MLPAAFPWTDRRLLLLSLAALLALVLGFFTFSADTSLNLVIYGGYWAMLLLTGLFAWLLWRMARSAWCERPLTWRDLACRPVLLVAACGTVLLVQETRGFKILMDEAMLLGTSMSMHFDKTALVPMRGNDIEGAFQVLAGQLDKRPLFQPFLVSVLHDLTGYRPENVFALNAILTYTLLGLAYLTGFRQSGRTGGTLAVLLLTSLPLLAQNATGGGFEVLNLVMILATLALGMRAMRRRDALSLDAFVLSGVLLAQTRYESVLFLLPVVLITLWIWWQERRPVLGWISTFAPLYMLPYALHNRVFSVRASSWELASQPGYEKPFALSYIGDNISHTLNFFFNTNGEQSNSLVLAILGFIALPFLLLWVYRTLQSARDQPADHLATALFVSGFAAHTALMMCYFWGRFDDPVIRRLSLPLNLFLVVAAVVVAGEFARSRAWIWRVLLLGTAGGICAHSLPVMARDTYTMEYYIGRECDWRREFIAHHPERDYLFIDNSSIIWITHLVSSTPMIQALQHKENIVFHLRNRSFSAIYVFQRFDVDPATGRLTPQKDDDLGPDYQLETVLERRFTPLVVSRISRVVSVREGPTTMPARVPPPLEKLSPEEREKVRQQYFEEFVKRLP